MFNHVWQGSTKLRGNNMIFSALSLLIFEASVPISGWRSLFECLSIYRQTWFTCLALGREPQTNGRENTIHLVQFTSRNVTVTISTREWYIRCGVTAGIHTNLYIHLHSAPLRNTWTEDGDLCCTFYMLSCCQQGYTTVLLSTEEHKFEDLLYETKAIYFWQHLQ